MSHKTFERNFLLHSLWNSVGLFYVKQRATHNFNSDQEASSADDVLTLLQRKDNKNVKYTYHGIMTSFALRSDFPLNDYLELCEAGEHFVNGRFASYNNELDRQWLQRLLSILWFATFRRVAVMEEVCCYKAIMERALLTRPKLCCSVGDFKVKQQLNQSERLEELSYNSENEYHHRYCYQQSACCATYKQPSWILPIINDRSKENKFVSSFMQEKESAELMQPIKAEICNTTHEEHQTRRTSSDAVKQYAQKHKFAALPLGYFPIESVLTYVAEEEWLLQYRKHLEKMWKVHAESVLLNTCRRYKDELARNHDKTDNEHCFKSIPINHGIVREAIYSYIAHLHICYFCPIVNTLEEESKVQTRSFWLHNLHIQHYIDTFREIRSRVHNMFYKVRKVMMCKKSTKEYEELYQEEDSLSHDTLKFKGVIKKITKMLSFTKRKLSTTSSTQEKLAASNTVGVVETGKERRFRARLAYHALIIFVKNFIQVLCPEMTTLRVINLMAGEYISTCLRESDSSCSKDNILHHVDTSDSIENSSNADNNRGLNAQENTNAGLFRSQEAIILLCFMRVFDVRSHSFIMFLLRQQLFNLFTHTVNIFLSHYTNQERGILVCLLAQEVSKQLRRSLARADESFLSRFVNLRNVPINNSCVNNNNNNNNNKSNNIFAPTPNTFEDKTHDNFSVLNEKENERECNSIVNVVHVNSLQEEDTHSNEELQQSNQKSQLDNVSNKQELNDVLHCAQSASLRILDVFDVCVASCAKVICLLTITICRKEVSSLLLSFCMALFDEELIAPFLSSWLGYSLPLRVHELQRTWMRNDKREAANECFFTQREDGQFHSLSGRENSFYGLALMGTLLLDNYCVNNNNNCFEKSAKHKMLLSKCNRFHRMERVQLHHPFLALICCHTAEECLCKLLSLSTESRIYLARTHKLHGKQKNVLKLNVYGETDTKDQWNTFVITQSHHIRELKKNLIVKFVEYVVHFSYKHIVYAEVNSFNVYTLKYRCDYLESMQLDLKYLLRNKHFDRLCDRQHCSSSTTTINDHATETERSMFHKIQTDGQNCISLNEAQTVLEECEENTYHAQHECLNKLKDNEKEHLLHPLLDETENVLLQSRSVKSQDRLKKVNAKSVKISKYIIDHFLPRFHETRSLFELSNRFILRHLGLEMIAAYRSVVPAQEEQQQPQQHNQEEYYGSNDVQAQIALETNVISWSELEEECFAPNYNLFISIISELLRMCKSFASIAVLCTSLSSTEWVMLPPQEPPALMLRIDHIFIYTKQLESIKMNWSNVSESETILRKVQQLCENIPSSISDEAPFQLQSECLRERRQLWRSYLTSHLRMQQKSKEKSCKSEEHEQKQRAECNNNKDEQHFYQLERQQTSREELQRALDEHPMPSNKEETQDVKEQVNQDFRLADKSCELNVYKFDKHSRIIGGLSLHHGIAFSHVTFAYPQLQCNTMTNNRSFDKICSTDARNEESLINVELNKYTYEEVQTWKPTLNDASFLLPSHTMTAIIGPTGAGKTTIFNLLKRLYEPLFCFSLSLSDESIMEHKHNSMYHVERRESITIWSDELLEHVLRLQYIDNPFNTELLTQKDLEKMPRLLQSNKCNTSVCTCDAPSTTVKEWVLNAHFSHITFDGIPAACFATSYIREWLILLEQSAKTMSEKSCYENLQRESRFTVQSIYRKDACKALYLCNCSEFMLEKGTDNYVDQDCLNIHGSERENERCDAKIVCNRLDKMLDMKVGMLSAGESQRVVLAQALASVIARSRLLQLERIAHVPLITLVREASRALWSNKVSVGCIGCLLLDESTSKLDAENEIQVQRAISTILNGANINNCIEQSEMESENENVVCRHENLCDDAAVHISESVSNSMRLQSNIMCVSIAHRLSSLRNASHMIVIEDGIVTAEGNVDYVISTNKFAHEQ